ncbi:MAG: serine/threonine-protein kinase, partial [Nannocystaceae bacterium]
MLRSVSRVLGGLAPQTDTQEDAVRALVYAGLGVRARPARLGRYRVGEVLGRGGSGTVFEAYDEQLDRTVAIKVMRARPEGAEHEDTAQRRLLREAKAAARLEHPNVVRVFDLGRYGAEEAEDLAGTIAAHGVFLVMERVDGIDLRRWMTTPRDPEDVMDVLLQAGEGLAAAHRCDLVHRDFKPANVLVGDGVVKVADFGLARSAHHSGLETPEGSSIDRLSTVTREGAVAGTPPYMAPEQYGGRPGPAADQFALCVTVYEALAGVRPFPDDPIEGQAAKLAGKVPPHPALSDELYAVLRRGLAPRAEQRYPTVRALLEDLRRPPRRSRRWPWLGLALAVGLGSLWSVTRPDPCTAPAPTIQALERLAAESEPPAQRRLRIEADALRDAWASVCNGDTVPEAHRRCLLERSEERSRLVALAQEGVLDASLVQEAIAKLPAPMSCVGQRPERSSEPADPRAAEAAGKLRARLTS